MSTSALLRPIALVVPEEEESELFVPGDSYASLKRQIVGRGLLRPQPLYYTFKIGSTLVLLGIAVAVMLLVRNPWVQVLNAVYYGFVLTQIAFLAHDTGHHQIVHRGWRYETLALLVGNVLLGVSADWWNTKHNAHHSHPNQYDMDPDIDIPIVAFSEEQALEKQGWKRRVVAWQAYLLVPLLFFQAHSMRIMGVRFLLMRGGRRAVLEIALLAINVAFYLVLLLHTLSVPQALGIFFFNQALVGIYMASVFAPNHKGMPMVEQDSTLDFMHRQIMTARNVRRSVIADFCTGGLNYQIEHHLFPSMPRNKLSEAQVVVKSFCATNGISYCETGLWRSHAEVLSYLNKVSKVVRGTG